MADPASLAVRVFSHATYDVRITSDRLGTMLLGQSITSVFEITRHDTGAPFDPEVLRLCYLKPNIAPGGEVVYPITFDGDGDPVVTLDGMLIAFARREGFTVGSFVAELVPPIEQASVGTWRIWIEGEDEDENKILANEDFVRVQAGRVRLPA